jgi:3-deoxy-D-manno-octulosonic acid kinase
MSELQTINHQGFEFRLSSPLERTELSSLISLCSASVHPAASVLGGRGTVTKGQVDGLGPIVVKHYRRGGLLSYLIERRYLRCGPTRAEQEFTYLERARSSGIRAPAPIASISSAGLLYQCWLVTQEIAGQQTLAEISLIDEERLRELMPQVVDQVEKLIDLNILHLDLHPGNVIVDQSADVYLIDFDKAQDFSGSKRELRDRYINRWRRAVIKHGLPDLLNELMSAGLRKNYREW